MYLISAYFAEQTNKMIDRYIHQIAQKTGNIFMIENHVPPHLTISSVEAKTGDMLIDYVKEISQQLTKGNIQFVSVGMLFPYVMYITPVLNEYLFDVSKQIYEVISNIPMVSVSKYYQPMQWLPHVTLGKKLTKEQMRIAFSIMQDRFAVFDGTITRIGLAKTNPHEDLFVMDL